MISCIYRSLAVVYYQEPFAKDLPRSFKTINVQFKQTNKISEQLNHRYHNNQQSTLATNE